MSETETAASEGKVIVFLHIIVITCHCLMAFHPFMAINRVRCVENFTTFGSIFFFFLVENLRVVEDVEIIRFECILLKLHRVEFFSI